MSDHLHYKSLGELSTLLENKTISAVELTQSCIDRIKATDDKLSAFISLGQEAALKTAEASDARRAAGKNFSKLDGVPVGIKDNIAVQDQPHTCASKILENYISPYTGTASQKLLDAGAVPLGRLNLDEFAMGSSTESSAYQTTKNPWNLDCIPGGSSGGSAAAVAAGQVPLALGSDTGGSIRQPASLCGIVGLKPTYGRVSRYGLAAFASSLDQIGPMTRTVEDAAHLLSVISGHDINDSTSLDQEVPDYAQAMKAETGPKTLGIPKEYFEEGLADDVREAVEIAITFYKDQGYTIKEFNLNTLDLALPTYYILATAEASSNLARYDGIRYTSRDSEIENLSELYCKTRSEYFGDEVKRRILLGTYVLSSGYYDAYYLRAQKARTLIRNDFMAAFNSIDAILTPTTPTAAFKAGEKSDPLTMYLADIYTISVNLAGLPAISIPCGFSNQMPIGLQLIGRPLEESTLLQVAHAFEEAHDYHKQTPAIS